MNVKDILHRNELTLRTLEQRSGVPLAYLKQLSAGNQGAGPATRAKLAKGYRSAAAQLLADADALERGPGAE